MKTLWFLHLWSSQMWDVAMAGAPGVGALVHWVIVIVVIALICWVLWWVLSQLPIPEPFRTVLRVVCVLVVALLIIYYILLPLLSIAFLGPLHPLNMWAATGPFHP
jgi:heme A synthase